MINNDDLYNDFNRLKKLSYNVKELRIAMLKMLEHLNNKDIFVMSQQAIEQQLNSPTITDFQLFELICNTETIKNYNVDLSLMTRVDNRSLAFPLKYTDNKYLVYIEASIFKDFFDFILTVFYWSDHFDDNEVSICCTNNLILTFYSFCNQKRYITTEEYNNKIKMLFSSERLVNISADMSWAMWSFSIAHEIAHVLLGHLESNENRMQQELDADAFAYKVFIDLICAQKERQANGTISELDVFSEYNFIAPILLMYFYELSDFIVKAVFGREIVSTTHPKPIDRRENIDKLFDLYLPDNFDTHIGNQILNSFMDTINRFKLIIMQLNDFEML